MRRAWELRARLEGWRQHFQGSPWQPALAETGLEVGFYLRQRSLREGLPWAHIDWGLTEEELRAAWQRISPGASDGGQGRGRMRRYQ